MQAGCQASQIGIIAPFRKQLKTIESQVQQLERKIVIDLLTRFAYLLGPMILIDRAGIKR